MFKSQKWPWKTAVVVFLICVFLWLFNLYVAICFGYDNTRTGLIGDSLGVVNALFSGLAFAGVILTLYSQKKDQDLRTFEQHFFALLELNRQAASAVAFKGATGNAAFHGIVEFLDKKSVEEGNKTGDLLEGSIEKLIERTNLELLKIEDPKAIWQIVAYLENTALVAAWAIDGESRFGTQLIQTAKAQLTGSERKFINSFLASFQNSNNLVRLNASLTSVDFTSLAAYFHGPTSP